MSEHLDNGLGGAVDDRNCPPKLECATGPSTLSRSENSAHKGLCLRPTASMIVAILSLLVAASGTAIASGRLHFPRINAEVGTDG